MNRNELLKTAKPILFNTDMVRAILDGRKTQTRRVLKVRYKDDEIGFNIVTNAHDGSFVRVEKYDEWEDTFDKNGRERIVTQPCYTDNILYVRETWQFAEGKYIREMFQNGSELKPNKYIYRADYDIPTDASWGWKWHPSIHMPKEAARIFLRVTDVRVEQLQDITISGIKAEGVIPKSVTGGQWQQLQDEYFKPVWNSTMSKKDYALYGWDANPWVWVISFERLEVDK